MGHLNFYVPYSGVVVVLDEPVDSPFEGLFEWSEFEVSDEAQQFFVRSRLPELPIGTAGIKRIFSFEPNGLDDRIGDVLDTDFFVFADFTGYRYSCEMGVNGQDIPLRMTGSTSSYSLSCQIKSLARSSE